LDRVAEGGSAAGSAVAGIRRIFMRKGCGRQLLLFIQVYAMCSVADPGCLSRIQGKKDSGSRIRIRIKEFEYFEPKKFIIYYASILQNMEYFFTTICGEFDEKKYSFQP
jgi:hypothetical protein